MSRNWKAELAGVVLLLATSQLQAATHDVTVRSNYFDPSIITIAPGDTVRWTLPPRNGTHDVTADDLSWASPQSSSFVYERTFNSIGDVAYFCSVHSSPGKSPGTAMNGIVRVQDEEETPLIGINPGLSDAWYDPATAGQGFFIIVWEEAATLFLSWFTYDTERPPQNVTAHLGEPGHRWLTAQGPYSGDTAALTVYETSGGVFDAAQPAPGPAQAVGTIELSWSSCTAGLLSYDLPGLGLAGDVPIQRIVPDNVPLCESLAAP